MTERFLPLRVGVLVAGPVVTASTARAVAAIAPAWTGVAPGPQAPDPHLKLYRQVDRRLFGGTDAPVELASARAEPPPGDLDVLIDLRESGPGDVWVAVARHGLWRIRGAAGELDALAAWEAGLAVVDVVLEIATPAGQRAHRLGTVALDPTSWQRSLAFLQGKAALWLPRCLRVLAAHGVPTLPHWQPAPLPAPPTIAPGAVAAARLALRLAGRLLHNKVRHHVRGERWCLAIRPRAQPNAVRDPRGLELWRPPSDRFYADPFLLRRDDRSHLFFEVLERGHDRGVIAHTVLGATGKPGPVEVVLERPHHLAYPHVFEAEGQTWMLPDPGGSAPIVLYRAEAFPRQWRPHATLLEGVRAVDPTLLQHGGRWWLFVNVCAPGGSFHDELCLYVADSLLGPYLAHPGNPIATDVRCARPAGRIFAEGGRLFRPAQDCAQAYGHGLALQEILTLTPTDYREQTVARLPPTWHRGLDGTHTYSADAAFEVVDARFRW